MLGFKKKICVGTDGRYPFRDENQPETEVVAAQRYDQAYNGHNSAEMGVSVPQ